MSNTEENNIFDLEQEDFQDPETKSGPTLYKPKAKEGKDGVYNALIRFVPNVHDTKNSRIMKHSHWLTDDEGNGFYFDCPTTVGDKCPICSKFFDLRESESALDQKRAPNFRRQTSHFHLVQIIDDKINPDLNGSIQIFKYGKTIDDKYQSQLSPEFGKPVIPSDVFEGKPFQLKVTQKGQWNNYDSCQFLESSPIEIDGKPMEKGNKNDMNKIVEYLKENSPELKKFGYTPWSDQDRKKINSILNGDLDDSVGDLESSLESNMSNSAESLDEDDTLNSFVESENSNKSKSEPELTPAAKQEGSGSSDSDDGFDDEFDDDFLNDL